LRHLTAFNTTCASSFAIFLIFFFSSSRRHTRFSRDWSSDVCSSDLPRRLLRGYRRRGDQRRRGRGDPEAVLDADAGDRGGHQGRSEEHTSELQSRENLVCRLLLEKKNRGASIDLADGGILRNPRGP